MRKQTPTHLVIDITANNYNRKTSEKENSYNNNHLWIISAFSNSRPRSWSRLSLSFSCSVANSEWRGNQAALHPPVLRKGRRRNLAAEGVGEWKQLFHWWSAFDFSPLFFFSFAFIFCHVDRIITLWFCEVGFQLFWREYCERAVRYWDGGERVISKSLIFHFLLTRSAKEKETERDRKCALALKRKENEKRKAEAWIEPVTKT